MTADEKVTRRRRDEAWQAQRRKQRMMRNLPLLGIVAAAVATTVVLASTGLLPGIGPNPEGITSNEPIHIHPTVKIYSGNDLIVLPPLIGISPSLWHDHTWDRYGLEGGLSPLHTHTGDSPGLVHVESTVTRNYTLGEFFAIWGQPLGPAQTVDLIADSHHLLTLSSDGGRTEQWGSLPFHDGQVIEIHYVTT